MRFWFRSKEEKKRLEKIQPFIDYMLQMVEKNSFEVETKAVITGNDPRNDDDNKDKPYLFKVASVYSFVKSRYIDHVYIYIKDRTRGYERLDKYIMKLTDDDFIYLDKLLLEWI